MQQIPDANLIVFGLIRPGSNPPGPDFKLGAHLKKSRRAEGGAKIVGVFHVKNHDFT